MIKGKRISIVRPARNEAEAIRAVIKRIPKYVDEIIVVDNGSSDDTYSVAQKAGAIAIKESRTRNGIGYGYAHITGIKRSTGDFIVAMDADDTYPASDVKDIVNKMLEYKLNFVSCNRFPLVNTKAISRIRQLGVKILNLEVRILYGFDTKDILTGMWVMDADAARALKLNMGDWNLSPEIKINAFVDDRIHYGEYHIDHFDRVGSSLQKIWKTGFGHLLYILRKRVTEDFRYLKISNYLKSSTRFEGLSILKAQLLTDVS